MDYKHSINSMGEEMQKWEVQTSSRRAGLYVYASTAEEALRKGGVAAYYPLHGHVTAVRPVADDEELIDTMGD